jgi:hypothetical protein
VGEEGELKGTLASNHNNQKSAATELDAWQGGRLGLKRDPPWPLFGLRTREGLKGLNLQRSFPHLQ